ncbi:TPA: GNAT family N-acetyltransferase [Legionella pneumophila subsp. pneumophila]|uniref:GNAT family N-acetyltransferase n=1 Tax=Legionella pneumophila TaxID=446 RepID=UPI0001527A17|nr:GNAT family N-acetyltransferase [Legionella pneumophila]HAT8850790.1 GNAT family N-acetyltransferase [Legionella pneumophila subsp. pneumophila]ABQ56126.1 hypothetical protein LPC_2202 [Legionella pneumophila str. Corby]ADG24439.1 hypothetical protein lpa_01661 [Legionella pneumophila 2300/99 Alcoy]MCH9069252.1 GNAT family N-acetyltransferase [Legionella pneumophila serogroup 1]MCH9149014.1 GNAT family N-acetyltransferase [Legionella pneumophila serogroup 1]
MSYQFELVTDIKTLEEQNKFIRQGILSFNDSFMGGIPEQYSIYLKDESNKIIGGAIVYAYISSIYVDVIWIEENYREKGLGTKLLNQVEAEALKRNIFVSTLDTFSFQAEQFYLKQGYIHLGIIKNYLNGHDRIYLRKELA